MTNKEMQRKRTMSYFINAADELIEEEGIKNITLRKVANKAGYNSATIYNYFENFDHLIFYAAMRYIKDYALALPGYLKDTQNAMDRFLKVWECFCNYSYIRPEIYYAIFFPNLDKDMEHYVIEYYKLFPEELGNQSEGVSTMLLKHNITERGMTTVRQCIEEGFIRKEDAEQFNDMTLLIYEGMLMRIMRNKISYEDAIKNTMKYIKSIVEQFLIKDYKFYY
ncbi:TetR/AcrR family transcriptional regulator [Tissierella sp. MSJ-40]|uniref:TetR/AcrR family transcriptional regulator n=1 Tax=Tissierella simiarum TaxID=2841534 RepID=A0ABS6EBE8_9FIRM|nr:TetR/AcrR family transcriptional regulator [Tissierella simiarum]MBU5440257.1 TetR/AcrR family transcriptional regulator [Tissierella simiarum]